MSVTTWTREKAGDRVEECLITQFHAASAHESAEIALRLDNELAVACQRLSAQKSAYARWLYARDFYDWRETP